MDLNPTQSPAQAPVKVQPSQPTNPTGGISFAEAMQKVLSGASVSRLEWSDKNPVFLSHDGFLSIEIDGKDHTLLLREVDMRPEDWYVL
jgi:hypothetical protein